MEIEENLTFSVTDVDGLRDRYCCPYIDVTHSKGGSLGNNLPCANARICTDFISL